MAKLETHTVASENPYSWAPKKEKNRTTEKDRGGIKKVWQGSVIGVKEQKNFKKFVSSYF